MGKTRGLTPKQGAFVREYVKDHNATQAAIRAGFSDKSAGVQGYQLLQRNSISEAVGKLEAKATNAACMEAAELKVFWTETVRNGDAELPQRLKASEHLAKTHGMFVEKREVTLRVSLEDLLS